MSCSADKLNIWSLDNLAYSWRTLTLRFRLVVICMSSLFNWFRGLCCFQHHCESDAKSPPFSSPPTVKLSFGLSVALMPYRCCALALPSGESRLLLFIKSIPWSRLTQPNAQSTNACEACTLAHVRTVSPTDSHTHSYMLSTASQCSNTSLESQSSEENVMIAKRSHTDSFSVSFL